MKRGCSQQSGATLVEFVVVVPTVLFLLLNLIQYGLLYHAKSQLNYAAFEAARAGTTQNADPAAIRTAFARAMTGYYGGGTTTAELAASYAKALADTTPAQVRIEILSPTKESFDDYHSPALAARLKTSSRVMPNTNLAFLDCSADVPSCNKDPKTNHSGQTLLDANLLKLRIIWGIPPNKQIPLAGRFMNWALSVLNEGDTDAFRQGLIAAGRIPVVTHVVMRMQSPAIEAGNASLPGPGNEGKPEDPGPTDPGPELPRCDVTDPGCTKPPKTVPPGDLEPIDPKPKPGPCDPINYTPIPDSATRTDGPADLCALLPGGCRP
ncbi:TadE/TadG family type IV pilus assembly protein [Massilia sp.]|uniref:TadE/TadG family type IV pilus assembly protein n=1 Tax=Massilia sp. TaxID=1882437 RepID=UPI003918C2CA